MNTNVKIMCWQQDDTNVYVVVSFLIKSTYPPLSWYVDGITVGLLLNAQRSDPNHKVVHEALRERAALAQSSLGAFEVLLVSPLMISVSASIDLITVRGVTFPKKSLKAPEGSRSNYLLVDSSGEVVSSLHSDILVGVTMSVVDECLERRVTYRPLFLEDVLMAQAIAMLGTSVGVLPIRRLDCQAAPVSYLSTAEGGPLIEFSFDSAANKTIRLLIQRYEEAAESGRTGLH